MIAAVARANGAGVVTRDIGGFAECGVPLIDPWQALS
jgi:predicted nucleic acid-binding protein